MKELTNYVDKLFQHQALTPEIKDLKEEILSNMVAKRDDLIGQGFDAKKATILAKESLSSIDSIIEGNQLTNVSQYRLECTQTLLLNSIIFWILSLPLLFTQYAVYSHLGIIITFFTGLFYLSQRNDRTDEVAFLSISASRKRSRIAWLVWGLFFVVFVGTMLLLMFSSNFWFSRPIKIDGPYQMAHVVARIYLPLLTILIPITFNNFNTILLKHRKEYDYE